MRGGLIGGWQVTDFKELETSPLYHAEGTEAFKGCLDRRRDRSCKGDPSGTLSFTFEYWALFASEDPASLVWGACWHPVVSGTGDFAGAQGVLVFADTPTHNGVKTRYIGNVTLKGHAARAGRAAAVGGSRLRSNRLTMAAGRGRSIAPARRFACGCTNRRAGLREGPR